MQDDRRDDNWFRDLFSALRGQMIEVSRDFGRKVREQIDLVVDLDTMDAPPVGSVYMSVAVESTNILTDWAKSSEDDEGEDEE